ncbi:MAG: hypothetical protein EH225_05800 [Calditrichaeota bacterium]|nr:hypothetical protein [Calditrichota bacterium]RQW04524.1 MAG: hypothetical protein EH225_05800 [Calditrichota bacterium]
MQFTIIAAVAGIIGTTGMTLFLYIIDKSGRINANMVKALGSAVTRTVETSLLPGLLIHYISGIIFAFLYFNFLQMLQMNDVLSLVLAGGIIGFAHGFAFSFVMVILAEHHPVEQFQNAGFQVAIVHFLAHIFYGLLVGLMFSLYSV